MALVVQVGEKTRVVELSANALGPLVLSEVRKVSVGKEHR